MDWPPWRVWKMTFRALGLFSDEGLTLETSALKLLTVANLNYQHNWYNQNYHIMITKRRWEQLTCFFCNKAKLYNSNDSVYLRLQLQHIVNSLNGSSEGRADSLFTTSTTPAFSISWHRSAFLRCWSSGINYAWSIFAKFFFNAGLKFRNFSTVAK